MEELLLVAVTLIGIWGLVGFAQRWDECTDGPSGPHPFGSYPGSSPTQCSWCGRHPGHQAHDPERRI